MPGLLVSVGTLLGDGMVFPERYYPKAEIPNQQALICYSGGIEHLVIETSFLGEGTNFAWVVPLPSVPEVRPVSENFFPSLQDAFQPTLVHRVNLYFAGLLFICGLIFLGARAMKDERSWVVDLPFCLFLAVGAGFMGRHLAFGIVAFGLALTIRVFARSSSILALILLIGTTFAAVLTFMPNARGPQLFNTLGGDSLTGSEKIAGVTVLAVQHAGLFETTTIQGTSPGAVLQWLERNGYEAPQSADPAIRGYIRRGWVFVASKARIASGGSGPAALHPLAFTFPSSIQVYPTSLTATGERTCSIDLFVFGNHRAVARQFRTVRCDRVSGSLEPKARSHSALRISEPEVVRLVGGSMVGTKLSAKLTPDQMSSDVEIGSSFFWRKGDRVYSYSGAVMIALNWGLPLAAFGWLFVGMSRGGWKIDERWITRSRWWSVSIGMAVGLAVFLFLPKVEIETVERVPNYESGGQLRRRYQILHETAHLKPEKWLKESSTLTFKGLRNQTS